MNKLIPDLSSVTSWMLDDIVAFLELKQTNIAMAICSQR